MKFSAFAVLPMLALAASAHGQAVPAAGIEQPVDLDNSVVVSIDARTGKLRAATDAEINALSADAAAASSARATGAAQRSWSKMPQTAADAASTMRTTSGKGMAMRVPLSAMSSWSAGVDSNGNLHVDEGGHTAGAHATEVSE